MNDKNLQYFLTVADERSISAAAKKLYISQPSLSQAIRRMEESVGQPLFCRTLNGIQLTDIGRQFYSAAAQTEKIWQDFQQNITTSDAQKTGSLSFGIPTHMGLRILPELLITLNKQFPLMNYNVVDQGHVELEKKLLLGELDLIITHVIENDESPKISYQRIFQDPFVLITSPERNFSQIPNMLKKRPDGLEINLSLLRKEKFIFLNEINQAKRVIDYTLIQADILNPIQLLNNNQFQTIQSLVSVGLGIAILPLSYLASHIPVNIYHLNPDYHAYWDVCIATKKNYTLNSVEKAFISIVKDICLRKEKLCHYPQV